MIFLFCAAYAILLYQKDALKLITLMFQRKRGEQSQMKLLPIMSLTILKMKYNPNYL